LITGPAIPLIFWVGGLLLPAWPLAAVAAAALAYGSLWHARGYTHFPGDRQRIQADRERALATRSGRVYFGALLGFGVLTRLTTPLVYALLAVAAAGKTPWVAIAAGLGFASGRSLLAVAGAVAARWTLRPADVASRITAKGYSDRILGMVAGALGLVTVLLTV
jgi:hypothetical protein